MEANNLHHARPIIGDITSDFRYKHLAVKCSLLTPAYFDELLNLVAVMFAPQQIVLYIK